MIQMSQIFVHMSHVRRTLSPPHWNLMMIFFLYNMNLFQVGLMLPTILMWVFLLNMNHSLLISSFLTSYLNQMIIFFMQNMNLFLVSLISMEVLMMVLVPNMSPKLLTSSNLTSSQNLASLNLSSLIPLSLRILIQSRLLSFLRLQDLWIQDLMFCLD